MANELDWAAGNTVFNKIGKGGFVAGATSGNEVVFDGSVPIGSTNLNRVTIGQQLAWRQFTVVQY